MKNDLKDDDYIESISCLTGYLTDKEIAEKYGMKIPTIQQWKNKTLKDEDSWRRIAYELFIRYVPEKDKYKANVDKEKIDLKRNITILEIGEKNYCSFEKSIKTYKRFISDFVGKTPTEVLKKRLNFLIECIDSQY